jgi:hypothetical protein
MTVKWPRKGAEAVPDPRIEEISPDLPYELQSKMFDQLATVSIAGAGLTVTLIGSLLRDAPWIVWLPVIGFGVAALAAISGNVWLIEGLTTRRPTLRRSKATTQAVVGLIGFAIGTLGMSVYIEGDGHRRGKEPAAAPAPADAALRKGDAP